MMDSSFTDAERRFVLAEMIKASHMDVSTLVDFVKSYNVQPDWLSMQLPGGRNMNQCIRAAETMLNVHLHPPPVPLPALKRKSIDDLSIEQQHVPKRLAMSPIEPHPPVQLLPQSHPPPHPHPPSAVTFPAGMRNVGQPRRLIPNGYHSPQLIAPAPPPNSAPMPTPATAAPATGSVKKRGRPSKADKEAQARASATGYVPVAPMPPRALTPQQVPSVLAASSSSPDYVPATGPPLASYHIVSGPFEPKNPRKGRIPAVDKIRPRGFPETRIESSERSPSANTLTSAPRAAAVVTGTELAPSDLGAGGCTGSKDPDNDHKNSPRRTDHAQDEKRSNINAIPVSNPA